MLSIGCPGSAQPAAPVAQPEPSIESPGPPAEPAAATSGEAVEAGFTHCCGNSVYRIEISCDGMVKRCYAKSGGGGWKQTYGRHCLRSLGEACYLEDCDAKCQ
jgi:hypothetical protein